MSRRRLFFGSLGCLVVALGLLITLEPTREAAPTPRSETSGAASESTPAEGSDAASAEGFHSVQEAPGLLERQPVVATTGSLDCKLRLPTGFGLGRRPEARFFVDGQERRANLDDAVYTHRLDGLTPGPHEIRVELPDHYHDAVWMDVVSDHVRGANLVLFPPEFVALVIETPGGEGIEAIAKSFQMTTKDMVDCLSLKAIDYAAPHGETSGGETVHISSLRRWLMSGFPAHSVAFLRLRDPRPCALELSFCDLPVGAESIPLGSRRVGFILDEALIRAGFARVRVHVIASEDGAPLTEARVSLHDPASSPEHNAWPDRADLQRRRPDSTGLVLFERVLPGDYEFEALREDLSVYQQRIHVKPGDELDLGSIVLDGGPPLSVQFVTEQGDSAEAEVKLFFLEPGRQLAELRSPVTASTRDGVVNLPKPMRPAFVHARQFAGSASVREIFDPSAPWPAGRTLVLGSLRRVEFTSLRTLEPDFYAELDDATGVLLGRFNPEYARFSMTLPTGSYRIRLFDGAGTEISSTDFKLVEDDQRVELR